MIFYKGQFGEVFNNDTTSHESLNGIIDGEMFHYVLYIA